MKLLETEKTLAFLDINPLSRGHAVCATLSTSFYLALILYLPSSSFQNITAPN